MADVVEEVMHKSMLTPTTSGESAGGQNVKKENKAVYPLKGVAYTLEVNLREGVNLIAKDLSGKYKRWSPSYSNHLLLVSIDGNMCFPRRQTIQPV